LNYATFFELEIVTLKNRLRQERRGKVLDPIWMSEETL
jgi:hypothetical protein